MEQPIKFREYLGNGKWHYWGIIDDTFVSPMRYYNGKKLTSYQYICVNDKTGQEVYVGDFVYVQWPEDFEGWEKAEVIWADGGYRLLYDGVAYDLHHMRYDKQLADIWQDKDSICVEIIGNIEQNPDMEA